MEEILVRLGIEPDKSLNEIKDILEDKQLDVLSKLDVLQARSVHNERDKLLEEELLQEIEQIEEGLHRINKTIKQMSVGLSVTKTLSNSSDEVTKSTKDESKEVEETSNESDTSFALDMEEYEEKDIEFIFDKATRLVDNPKDETDYKKAIVLYNKIIRLGGICGVSGIARMLLHGIGVEKDEDKAYSLIEEAAESGEAYALYLLGMLEPPNKIPKFLRKNRTNSYQLTHRDSTKICFWKSAVQGCPNGQNALARYYLSDINNVTDYNYGISLLKSAAMKNYAVAESNLSKIYMKEDPSLADEYLIKAANHGHTASQVKVGEKYLASKDPKVIEEGKNLILKADFKGNSRAKYLLGYMYQFGIGVEKDKKEALQYYMDASDMDEIDALNKLGWMYYNGDGIKRDVSKFMDFLSKAADNGHIDAAFNLGDIHRSGSDGVDINNSEAFRLYKQAAEGGHKNAQYRLGLAYLNGIGVKTNKDEALHWIEKAIENGSIDAYYAMGLYTLYYNNDTRIAKEYFIKAIKNDCIDGNHGLAILYSDTKYRELNLISAYKYYKLAGRDYKGELDNFIIERSKKKDTESFELVKYAAEDNPSYMILLGHMYENREEASVIALTSAYHCYKISGSKGRKELERMILHWGARNGTGCFKFINGLANENDPFIFKAIANMHYNGLGTNKDYKEAYRYYKLAEHAYKEEYNNFIESIAQEDSLECFILLKRISEEGNSLAMKYLGDMYFHGLGTDKNYSEANQYYKKAYEGKLQGVDFVALFSKVEDAIFRDMTYAEAVKMLETSSFQKGIDALLKLANENYSDAQITVGKLYMNGYRISKDNNKAMSYFKMAQSLNHPDAKKYMEELRHK